MSTTQRLLEEGPTNFIISNYDLSKDDWSLKSEVGAIADVQGTEEVGIFIESADDEQFEILIRYVDKSGTLVVEADQNVDAELLSTSPAGANHFAFGTIATVNRFVEVVVTDFSGNSPNRIDGTLNFH